MQKAFAGISVLVGLLATSACGRLERVPEPTSTVKFDIDVDKNSVDPKNIKGLLAGLAGFVKEGTGKVTLGDLLATIENDGVFKRTLTKIVATREVQADVTCAGRNCHVISKGQEFSFVLEGVKIPVLGTPTVQLSKQIDLYATISEDGQSIDACKILGIKAKTGILTNAVNGAAIAVDADVLKTLKVGVGAGGTYPNTSCLIAAATAG